ncbi:glycosyltransferase family 4 protein [Flavobacterium cheniae]|uniref:Glycosyltransferase involved in cell wall biosynthesis n=1 Tax=Flavobacterium cheniae TaxID=295428 RepID=A0A562KP17_9FLAO|nr:glycosyltransferase family 4 protein [Flavobacterium cheniae]TDR22962.1 glycosyltransferase involved in cell wall biosynthesis [Flavobacterium cheniae]TWH97178.1 glycosyltransferase involved in cell wall biosynthesis [Flavobacterium cheniae]
MHIAFLTPEYPHSKIKHSGGLGTSIKNLVVALVAKGVKVTVFVYGQPKSEVFEENEIVFHFISDKKYRLGKWFFYRKHLQNYINSVVKKEKIDLIEAPDWTGVTAFINFTVPLVIRFHGSDTYFCHIEKRKQKFKNRLFETLAVRKAKGFIAPTKYAGEVSAELFGLHKEKIKTIHYGLDLTQFNNEYPESFEKGLVLYIGTIIRKKGVFELPEIFHKVRNQFPEAQLVLIGGDSGDVATGNKSTWELVKQQFYEKDLEQVSYSGKMPYAEVQDYIKKANACVFPTYAETLGMVTIESMAMKKAVVNSNIGWAQELMQDGKSGFLVHPANHEVFAQKIITLLSDTDCNAKMGNEARLYVEEHFDITKKVAENINYYQHLIK